ncbi:MAG: hypothetical protein ACLR23_08630 [Clostridia bacterium]
MAFNVVMPAFSPPSPIGYGLKSTKIHDEACAGCGMNKIVPRMGLLSSLSMFFENVYQNRFSRSFQRKNPLVFLSRHFSILLMFVPSRALNPEDREGQCQTGQRFNPEPCFKSCFVLFGLPVARYQRPLCGEERPASPP